MNRQDIKKLQNNLKKGNKVMNYDTKELDYITSPIGKAIYKKACEEQEEKEKKELQEIEEEKQIKKDNRIKKKRADPNDKIKCELCGVEYTRCNRSRHEKTRIHKLYKDVNDKFKNLLLNN